jgi:hypothetical protein
MQIIYTTVGQNRANDTAGSYVKILFKPDGKFYNWKTVYLPPKNVTMLKCLGTL